MDTAAGTYGNMSVNLGHDLLIQIQPELRMMMAATGGTPVTIIIMCMILVDKNEEREEGAI